MCRAPTTTFFVQCFCWCARALSVSVLLRPIRVLLFGRAKIPILWDMAINRVMLDSPSQPPIIDNVNICRVGENRFEALTQDDDDDDDHDF